MSIHAKGRICYLHEWEAEDFDRGIQPDCKNHRHISTLEALEITGDPRLGEILLGISERLHRPLDSCFVKIAGRIEYVVIKYPLKTSTIEFLGKHLEQKHGMPFTMRKKLLKMSVVT